MKKLIASSLLVFGLVGCSEPQTQFECLEEGLWKHDGECKVWNEIPEEDEMMVLNEVAVELSDRHGITIDEAYELMYNTLFGIE